MKQDLSTSSTSAYGHEDSGSSNSSFEASFSEFAQTHVNRLKKATAKIAQFSKEKEKFHLTILEKSTEIKRLNALLDSKHKEIIELNSSKEKLTSNNADLKSELRALEKRYSDLELSYDSRLNAIGVETEQLMSKIEMEKAENLLRVAESADLKKQLQDTRDRKDGVTEELLQMQKQLDEKKLELGQLQENYDSYKLEQNKEMTKKFQEYEERLGTLQTQLEEKDEMISLIRQEKNQMEHEKNKLIEEQCYKINHIERVFKQPLGRVSPIAKTAPILHAQSPQQNINRNRLSAYDLFAAGSMGQGEAGVVNQQQKENQPAKNSGNKLHEIILGITPKETNAKRKRQSKNQVNVTSSIPVPTTPSTSHHTRSKIGTSQEPHKQPIPLGEPGKAGSSSDDSVYRGWREIPAANSGGPPARKRRQIARAAKVEQEGSVSSRNTSTVNVSRKHGKSTPQKTENRATLQPRCSSSDDDTLYDLWNPNSSKSMQLSSANKSVEQEMIQVKGTLGRLNRSFSSDDDVFSGGWVPSPLLSSADEGTNKFGGPKRLSVEVFVPDSSDSSDKNFDQLKQIDVK